MLAAVENVSDDVETVHSQTLGKFAEGRDEIIRTLRIQDRIQDLRVIERAVVVLVLLRVHELVDDEGELLRHGPADLVARILGGDEPGQLDQPLQKLLVDPPAECSPCFFMRSSSFSG